MLPTFFFSTEGCNFPCQCPDSADDVSVTSCIIVICRPNPVMWTSFLATDHVKKMGDVEQVSTPKCGRLLHWLAMHPHSKEHPSVYIQISPYAMPEKTAIISLV